MALGWILQPLRIFPSLIFAFPSPPPTPPFIFFYLHPHILQLLGFVCSFFASSVIFFLSLSVQFWDSSYLFLSIHFPICMSVSFLFLLSQSCRRNNCPEFHNIYFCGFLQVFSNKYLMFEFQYVDAILMVILKEKKITVLENCWARNKASLEEQAGLQGPANIELRAFRLTFSSWKVWLSGGCFPRGEALADCFVRACWDGRR